MKIVAALLPMILAGALACSAPDSNGRYVQTDLPNEAAFSPVSVLLDVRCGSLDCHGNVARNLRMYGSAGRRLAATDQPFAPACNTSGEIHEDFISVVGLEPEKMSAVVAGADPGTLTMMRKARGTEAHKGLQIWTTGDDSDNCVVSWLKGSVDRGACTRAVTSAVPTGADNPLVACVSQ